MANKPVTTGKTGETATCKYCDREYQNNITGGAIRRNQYSPLIVGCYDCLDVTRPGANTYASLDYNTSGRVR